MTPHNATVYTRMAHVRERIFTFRWRDYTGAGWTKMVMAGHFGPDTVVNMASLV